MISGRDVRQGIGGDYEKSIRENSRGYFLIVDFDRPALVIGDGGYDGLSCGNRDGAVQTAVMV